MRRVLSSLLLLLAVPAFAQQAPRTTLAIEIESKILTETRTLLVRTPATYANAARAYPVIYMTDGERQLEHFAAVVDFLVREGRMPEVIVVAITNTDRTRDLTPTHLEERKGDFGPLPTSGGGDRFLDFISSEVMPYVEKNYRTRPFRVFAGHSFGGLLGMHAFFTRPALFNGVIAVSPSLTWDDRYVYRRANEWLKSASAEPKALVFSVGNEGEALDREFDALQQLLKKRAPRSLEWQAFRFDDEDHGSVVLPTHYAALRKVFEPFRFAIDPRADPKTLYAQARDHFANTSRRVGYTVPVPEVTANQIGYRLLQAGHLREAIEVFRANVDAWPESANVYDSLGEAQERAGQRELARANYNRAWELGRKSGDPNTAAFEQNAKRLNAQ